MRLGRADQNLLRRLAVATVRPTPLNGLGFGILLRRSREIVAGEDRGRRCEVIAAPGDTSVPHVGSAPDHHAFHEDAEPGDLGLQLGTRRFSSSKKLRTSMTVVGELSSNPTGRAIKNRSPSELTS